MTLDDKIWNEKLQYYINRESALSSSKIYKYKYVTGEDILPQIKVDEECSEILNLSDN